MNKSVLLFALLASSSLLAERLPWSQWIRQAPIVAAHEDAGIVVRQYTGTSHMAALLANPGPDVTGIHVLSYAQDAAGLEASVATELATIRTAGLKPYPGARIGRLGASSDCTVAQHWIDVAGLVAALDDLTVEGEMIVLDVENYTTSTECTDAYLAAASVTYADLLVLMAPLLGVIEERSIRVGMYPANADDAVMRAIFDAAGDGSEAWMESGFDAVVLSQLDEVAAKSLRQSSDLAWAKIEARHPGVHRREGYYDDLLRSWGDGYRASTARVSRAWVFDYTRSDRASWGTSTWLSGESAQGLNAGVLNVWPMLPLDGGGSSIVDAQGSDDLAEKWSAARQSAGYGTPGLIRREGWGPGLEWLAEGYVASSPSAQTYRVGIKLDDVSGDRAILSMWTDHPTGNTFALWLDDGAVVLDVYSQDYTTTRITVDAAPTTATKVYVLGWDGTTVRVEGQADVTLGSPVSCKTLVRIGLKGQTSSPVFAGSSVYVGPIVRWGRLLSASEMTAAKAGAWPYGRGL